MNFTDFHFIRPYWLVALLPFCGALIFLIRRKLSQGNWTAMCDSELLPYLLQDTTVKPSRAPLIGGSIAGLLAVIALAGPTLERLPTPVFRNDSALVIALDLSRSMDAGDIKPSRLTMARYKIADILKQRKDGQTALLVFADDAFTVTPLTNDTQTIDSQLSALTTAIMPGDGNNLGRALEKSVQLLKQAGLQKGQVLLLTDGGNIDQGLDQAKTLDGYQLLILGVGTVDGAPIALENGGFLKDAQGGIIVDKVDVSGLEKLAQAGNGAYQPITPDDSDINNLLATVAAKLQEQDKKNENLLLEQWSDLGPWLLLMVLPLAALSFRKGLLAVALLAFLPFPKTSYALDKDKLWQDLWQTKDQQAQQAYRQGDYGKAAELFENSEWKEISKYQVDKLTEGDMKEPNTALGYYNQGTIFAKSGESNYKNNDLEKAVSDYEKSIAKYSKALTKNPKEELKADIKNNQEIVSKELEKLKKELEKQKQQQQQNQNNQDDKNQDKQQDSKDNKSQESNRDGKKSDQSDQENKDQQDKADQKPEQKPEQSKESTEHQPDKKDAEEQPQDQVKPKEAEQQKDAQKDPQKPDNAQQAQETELSKEEQQAAEQWLKRIPDDPAGLLRRKFKYQYDQRGQQ